MTTDAGNTPEVTGQEIIAHSLPSDNNVDNNSQGLEDAAAAAELPFGNDAPEDEEHGSSNQTSGFFNRRTILLGGTILVLCAVVGLSSAALTSSNNNNVVVESFNNALPRPALKPAPAPTKASKAPKASKCLSSENQAPWPPAPDGDCDNCCDDCEFNPNGENYCSDSYLFCTCDL